MKNYLQYVISISQSWLDNKKLIPASHCYVRVVVRWPEILASYKGQPNLMVIMFGIVLEQLKAQ